MLSLFYNKKLEAFGLDISEASIKVMQLEPSKNGFLPYAFSEVPLAAKVMNNHIIINELKLSQNILAAVEAAKKITTKRVVVSVPEAKSFVRVVEIPQMPAGEVTAALPWEMEQDIPVPVDQVYLDWQFIKNIGDKMQILVMAASKEYVDPLINSLKLAKLIPIAIELDSQSMSRALIGKEESKKAVLILDIATTQSTFIIVENGNIQYTSSIPIAGNAFTESIARSLGVPAVDAEKIKRERGLTTEARRGSTREAILPLLDNIIDEIKNVSRFYEDHSELHRPIEQVILCGGSSRMTGISDYITARLGLGSTHGLNVGLGDPFVNLMADQKTAKKSIFAKTDPLAFTTVIGLALRDIESK
jgi:type IV pilus assembly protein PilM